MRVLAVGDRFIPAGYCVDALAEVCGARFGPERGVDWPGTKAEAARGASRAGGPLYRRSGARLHDQEPLPVDSPWRGLDNVTITTYYAGDTTTTTLRSARLVAEAVAELAATGRCAAAVNTRELGWV